LALTALRLEPVLAAAGAVRQVVALGDDAFEAQAAAELEHGRPVNLEMLAETDRRARRQIRERLLKQVLALEQRHLGEVEAGQIIEIEGEVAHAIVAAGLQIGLKIVQAGEAARILDHDFTVDERGAERKFLQRRRDGGKALRPVERLARQETNAAAVDARLRAIAVMLDLVDP